MAQIDIPEEEIGVAFSGGGIRSAALSSGVLRRLLHREVKFGYVSCVSGGNYTAAAYLDWKYRHKNTDDPDWHKKFFEHMRSRAGYLCNWKNPLQGILESIILVFLVITVNLLIPCIIYSAGAIPSAYVIDYVLGAVMRKGFNCSDVPQTSKGLNTSERHCTQQFEIGHPEVREQFYLFSGLFLAFFVSYFVKTIVPTRRRSIARYFKILSGLLLALTFFPWLIQQSTGVLPSWLNALIIFLSIFFWLGFPPLRGEVSLVLMVYFYAFVVKWRVYETSVLGIVYEEQLFYTLLFFSGFFLWLTPFVGMFSTTAVFVYYRWRLQRAFFTETSVGPLGCKGIGCRDFFPILSCTRPERNPERVPLMMDDLTEVKPEYISCVAVDYWRKEGKELPYAVMALSPNKIERIDDQPGKSRVSEVLKPENVSVADAMVTSAAVMTLSPEQEEPYRDLQVQLGLTLRKGFSAEEGGIASKISTILIQSIVALPVILLAVIWFANWEINAEGVVIVLYVVIALFVAYPVIFFGIAMFPTCVNTPNVLKKFARWCHVHLYHVRMLREFFQVDNVGPRPPALLSLSDGGRLEKFGLLPLLKKQLKKILIVDGSFIRSDEDYAKQILRSLDQARKELHCEFVGCTGRDVKEEMQKEYVDVPRDPPPRYYKFKVQYYDKQPDKSYERVKEGEIMIIAPRYPIGEERSPDLENNCTNEADRSTFYCCHSISKVLQWISKKLCLGCPCTSTVDQSTPDLENNWNQYHNDTRETLDEIEWGRGPVLSVNEVDRLTFCCCECCHSNSKVLQWISKKLCLGFPSTSTVNQFFTSSLYTAYHREGYRACVESDAEIFLTKGEAEGPSTSCPSGTESALPHQTEGRTLESNRIVTGRSETATEITAESENLPNQVMSSADGV